jgi:hypothetical protein
MTRNGWPERFATYAENKLLGFLGVFEVNGHRLPRGRKVHVGIPVLGSSGVVGGFTSLRGHAAILREPLLRQISWYCCSIRCQPAPPTRVASQCQPAGVVPERELRLGDRFSLPLTPHASRLRFNRLCQEDVIVGQIYEQLPLNFEREALTDCPQFFSTVSIDTRKSELALGFLHHFDEKIGFQDVLSER